MGGNIRLLAVCRICIHQSKILTKRNLSFSTTLTMGEPSKLEFQELSLEKAKSQLKRIYQGGVRAVLPFTIIENSIHISGNNLQVASKTYNLTDKVYLVGFGKAVMGMAVALEKKLGTHLKKGIVSIPRGSITQFQKARSTELPLPMLSGSINYRENSVNNQPDSDTFLITREIVDLVKNLKENDTLIVLVSGGGSALLCMPKPMIKPKMKLELCKKLQNSGADIKQVNIVRKKLSMVKGGGLARMAHPARVISLILSDIVGDSVDLIASGPTIYSQTDSKEAVSILQKFNLYDDLEDDLKTLLRSEESGDDRDLLNEQKEFAHVDSFVIGNNTLAITAASHEALSSGLKPIILNNDIVGCVEPVSKAYARVTSHICRAWNKNIDLTTFSEAMMNDLVISMSREKVEDIFHVLEETLEQGIVLIGAGEPTVIVQGSGIGGRNQELALRFSLDWFEIVKNDPRLADFEVTFLSAGTDGQDGPTDATGAFGYPAIGPMVHVVLEELQRLSNEGNIADESKEDIADGSRVVINFGDEIRSLQSMLREAEKLKPESVLANNDSYNFYSRFRWGKDLLKTGISGTNVMDLHLVLVKKRQYEYQINFDRVEKITNLLKKHDLHTRIDEPTKVTDSKSSTIL